MGGEAVTAATVLDLFRLAADVALTLVPVEVLRNHLDDAAVRRANALADAASLVKFGRK